MKIYVGSAGTPKGKGSVTGNGEGIYTLEWDGGSELRLLDVLKADNASLITMSEDGKYLYSVNETKDFGGLNGSGGGITACRIDPKGRLIRINDSLSYGSRPAYVIAFGNYLAAANHGSHSTVTCHYMKADDGTWKLERGFDDAGVALFERRDDGGIGKLLDLKKTEGHGYWCRGGGQSTSHVHCVRAKGNLLAACDRGADRILILRAEDDRLSVLSECLSEPGMAPRYAVFHPQMDILYVLNENYPCLTVYSVDTESGKAEPMQTIGTMDAAYEDKHAIPHFIKREAAPDEHNDSAMGDRSLAMPADLHITADGRFLYASNRYFGGASLAVFHICEDGRLRKEEVCGMDGMDLRGFGISRDGRYLAVTLLDRNRVEIRKLDPETGRIGLCLAQCEVPSPSAAVFSPA